MFDPQLINLVLYSVAGGLLAYLVMRLAFRAYVSFRDDDVGSTPPKPGFRDGQTHCLDCGSQLSIRQFQQGFTRTGKPNYLFHLICPASSTTRPTASPSNPVFPSFFESVIDCGRPVSKMVIPEHGHEQGETKTDCVACIDQMLDDKVIDVVTARRLLSSLGRLS